jgi:hypothetical protein
MDELYFIHSHSEKIENSLNHQDSIILFVILFVTIIQIFYICYIARLVCHKK